MTIVPNREHLGIQKQGSTHWHRWREQHPQLRPDLSGANLQRLPLREAHLQNVDRRWANLSRAPLRDVDLFRADLTAAH
ncbi:MAG: pentapeptide repeat-containing protein [Pseudanabaenaceae cyanobacterium]